MDREQIKKHGELIKWFIDNPDEGVWVKLSAVWVLINNPVFHVDRHYVQNDEYAEFRKPLADGKVVEVVAYKDSNGIKHWNTAKYIDEEIPSEYYRIKPDKYEFKVGDWGVVQVDDKYEFKVGDWVVDSVDNKLIEFYEDFYIDFNYLNDEQFYIRFQKWIPENGELCVFWDNACSDEYIAGNYGGSHKKDSYHLNENAFEYSTANWDNVAPVAHISELNTQRKKL